MRISSVSTFLCLFFFFNDTATTEIYTLSLHDALPISATSLVALTATVWPMPTRTLAPLGVTRPAAMVTATVTSEGALGAGDGDGGCGPLLSAGGVRADDGTVDPVGCATSAVVQPVVASTSSSAAAARRPSRFITHWVGMIRTLPRWSGDLVAGAPRLYRQPSASPLFSVTCPVGGSVTAPWGILSWAAGFSRTACRLGRT